MMPVYGLPKFGATGRFTHGKLNPNDEGELWFGISVAGSVIRIDLGKPVAWFALYPDYAKALAEALLLAAAEAEKDGRS